MPAAKLQPTSLCASRLWALSMLATTLQPTVLSRLYRLCLPAASTSTATQHSRCCRQHKCHKYQCMFWSPCNSSTARKASLALWHVRIVQLCLHAVWGLQITWSLHRPRTHWHSQLGETWGLSAHSLRCVQTPALASDPSHQIRQHSAKYNDLSL